MTIPALNLYEKFGNPYKLVEFRLFSFNTCGAGCKNCFYQKTNNNFTDFEHALKMAEEMDRQDYELETCYILPTDIFENEFNYRIFDDENLKKTLSYFNYVGFASTLRNGFDRSFFHKIYSDFPHINVELQVNILEEQIFNDDYLQHLDSQFTQLRELGGKRILINLALNTGTVFNEKEVERLKFMAERLSDDSILELNFTFLFNNKLSKEMKSQLMTNSYSTIKFLSEEFRKHENPYNDMTILRKPSFFFKDGKIFVSPIIPFDEYVFINENDFVVEQPSFVSFLETYGKIETRNRPLWKMCDTCENLKVCQGKGFFVVADHFKLGCFKEGA